MRERVPPLERASRSCFRSISSRPNGEERLINRAEKLREWTRLYRRTVYARSRPSRASVPRGNPAFVRATKRIAYAVEKTLPRTVRYREVLRWVRDTYAVENRSPALVKSEEPELHGNTVTQLADIHIYIYICM